MGGRSLCGREELLWEGGASVVADLDLFNYKDL